MTAYQGELKLKIVIVLHRLNNKEFILNAELIKFLEATPDTVVTLSVSNEKFMVKESIEEIIQKVLEYKRKYCEVVTSEER